MEQFRTSALVTPATEFSNSCLDLSSLDSPSHWNRGNVFSQLSQHFEHYNGDGAQSSSESGTTGETGDSKSGICISVDLQEDYFSQSHDYFKSKDQARHGHLEISRQLDYKQNLILGGGLLSPNSRAIIERNKLEGCRFSREQEKHQQGFGLVQHSVPSTEPRLYSHPENHGFAESHDSLEAINVGAVKKKRKGYTGKKDTDAETLMQKRVHVLERNRIAAGKCRKRKKESISSLEEKCHALKSENTAMRNMACELMNELESWKFAARQAGVGNYGVENGRSEEVQTRDTELGEADEQVKEEASPGESTKQDAVAAM
ncbi:hypothetical protein BJ878DRAFT_539312 [Calycina marina]|uniref:BZIP domain-containing protein n=1 Tax=Calycina marina TaxID=1763456 RepID=A0A9P7Z8A8_9HELO|nr:hypothetical protein BJ878DRAFT_539312 [Calycina marina]